MNKQFKKESNKTNDMDKNTNNDIIEDVEMLEEQEENSYVGEIIIGVLFLLACVAFFFFGGWGFVVGEEVNLLDQTLVSGQLILDYKDILFDDYAIAININDKYYGFYRMDRFFDSSVIQWGMLIMSIGTLWYGLKAFFNAYRWRIIIAVPVIFYVYFRFLS